MNNIASSLWLHASEYHTTTELLQSHAVALVCVYVFWYYNFHLPTTTNQAKVRKANDDDEEEEMIRTGRKDDDVTTTTRSSSSTSACCSSRSRSEESSSPSVTFTTKSSAEEEEDESSTSQNHHAHKAEADDDDAIIAIACPNATPVERRRFLIARNFDVPSAIVSLTNYLDWNDRHESIAKQYNIVNKRQNTTSSKDEDDGDDIVDYNDIDKEIWIQACRIAMIASGEEEKEEEWKNDDDKSGSDCDDSTETTSTILPQVVRTYDNNNNNNNIISNNSDDEKSDNHQCRNNANGIVADVDGYRIFHILPALMDHNLAQGSTYALATALFINLHLDRSKDEKITVCMDIRAGQGWPNIHALYQIPFMKETTTSLLSLFPERLHKCLVYPIPPSFTWIWTIISKIIDQRTVDKIKLLAGPNKIISPPPIEEMKPILGQGVGEFLEQARINDFIIPEE